MRDGGTGEPGQGGWRWGVFASLAGVAVFAPSLFNGFVYDDIHNVVNNPHIKSWLFLESIWTDPQANSGLSKLYPTWRPLRLMSWLLDYQVAGLAAWWYHLVNVVLHGAVVGLLFAVMRRLGIGAPAAAIGALVFAVHPVQTETVLWIKERDGLLCHALLLLGIWWALGRHLWQVPAALLAFTAALLSKESAVAAGPVLVLLAGCEWMRGERDPARWRRWVLLLGGAFAVTVAYLAVRSTIMGSVGQMDRHLGGTWAATQWTMAGMFARYLGLLAWPHPLPLAFSHLPVSGVGDPAAWAGVVLLGGLVALALATARRQPLLAVGIGWMLVSFLPVSNIVPMVQWMAVRFWYFPLAGAAVAVAVAAEWVLARERTRGPAVAVFAILCVAWSAASVARTLEWRDNSTLWMAEWNRGFRNPETIGNTFTVVFREGRLEEALAIIELFDFENEWRNRTSALRSKARVLEELGRIAEADAWVMYAFDKEPSDIGLLLFYARYAERRGRLDEAVRAWETLALMPKFERYAPRQIERIRKGETAPGGEWDDAG